MGKLTMVDGTVFEGTTEECYEVLCKMDAVNEPEFKVDDYVKTLDFGRYGGIAVGVIGVVTDKPDEKGDHRVVVPLGDKHDYFHPDLLLKATEEEVEEVIIWSEFGRSVGDFREGDLVKAQKKHNLGRVVGELRQFGGLATGRLGVLENAKCWAYEEDSIELLRPATK